MAWRVLSFLVGLQKYRVASSIILCHHFLFSVSLLLCHIFCWLCCCFCLFCLPCCFRVIIYYLPCCYFCVITKRQNLSWLSEHSLDFHERLLTWLKYDEIWIGEKHFYDPLHFGPIQKLPYWLNFLQICYRIRGNTWVLCACKSVLNILNKLKFHTCYTLKLWTWMLLWATSNYDTNMFHQTSFSSLFAWRGNADNGYLPIPRMVLKNGAFCAIMLTGKI